MPLTWQREVEGWKWSHCISIEQAWLADRAGWLQPIGGRGCAEEVRGRGSTILGALHRTVRWGQSAKPSSHPSIIKSVTVDIFWHERWSTLITTEDPTTGIKEEKSSCLFDRVWTSCNTDAVICAPALRNARVHVRIHKKEAVLQRFVFFSHFKVMHSEQSIALYGEDGFSAELWTLCQIRLRAAYSLLTGAAFSNDPWWESHLLWW